MSAKTEALWLHTLPGGYNWTIQVPCYVLESTAKRVKISAKKKDGAFEERWVKPEKLIYKAWSIPKSAPPRHITHGLRPIAPGWHVRTRKPLSTKAARVYEAVRVESIAPPQLPQVSDAGFIIGLMRQGYNTEPNQLGFIPAPKIEDYYVPREQYVIQHDNRGRNVGYILTGSYRPGKLLKIEQAIIDIDRRNIGFGEMAVQSIIERGKQQNVRAIVLHCAANLEANEFWQAMGFNLASVRIPHNKRHRAINVYMMDLWPTLWVIDRPAAGHEAGERREGHESTRKVEVR